MQRVILSATNIFKICVAHTNVLISRLCDEDATVSETLTAQQHDHHMTEGEPSSAGSAVTSHYYVTEMICSPPQSDVTLICDQ